MKVSSRVLWLLPAVLFLAVAACESSTAPRPQPKDKDEHEPPDTIPSTGSLLPPPVHFV